MYLPGEEGQGLYEYALILLLVVFVVIGIVAVLGDPVSGLWAQATAMFTGR